MDKLKEAALYYHENLEGKEFLITAGKKGCIIQTKVKFEDYNFKHLIGIHKLVDLPISLKGSKSLYQQILDDKTTYKDIESSRKIKIVYERIEVFNKMCDVVTKPQTMAISKTGAFNSIQAETLLSRFDNKNYLHLFLKNDEKKEFSVPVSYFSVSGSSYLELKYTTRWTVLSVEEVHEKERENIKEDKVFQMQQESESVEDNWQKEVNNVEETSVEVFEEKDSFIGISKEKIEDELEKIIGSKTRSNEKDNCEEKQKEENEKPKKHSNKESDWEEYVRYMNFVNQQNNKKTREREDEGPERDDY